MVVTALIATPAPARAATPTVTSTGTCSIRLPAKVAIAAVYTPIVAHAGSDCAASGMVRASWGADNGMGFAFSNGTTTSTYRFFQLDPGIGLWAVRGTGALDANQNALVQNTAQIVIKDASWAYIASSRHGSVVHINGLVHEWTIGPDHGGGRTVYLQRYLIPLRSWQNMLRLTANSLGRVSAGFVQARVYQYRWVVTETTTWWGTHSASTFR
jgi:hypothetical protein